MDALQIKTAAEGGAKRRQRQQRRWSGDRRRYAAASAATPASPARCRAVSRIDLRQDRRQAERPARRCAATPTAIMAPEIKPPGRFAHRNSAPPALPITSVSSTLRVLARVGTANAIETGIRLTLPYGKSEPVRQMHQSGAALRVRLRLSGLRRRRKAQRRTSACLATGAVALRRSPSPFSEEGGADVTTSAWRRRLAAFLHVGHELLALLAVEGLGVGFLRAFERGGRSRLLHFLFRLGAWRSRRRGGLRKCRTDQEQGRDGEREQRGRISSSWGAPFG